MLLSYKCSCKPSFVKITGKSDAIFLIKIWRNNLLVVRHQHTHVRVYYIEIIDTLTFIVKKRYDISVLGCQVEEIKAPFEACLL